MTLSLWIIFWLGLPSLATAANSTLIFQSNRLLDYKWPSAASRTQALEDGTFKPEDMKPSFMTANDTRIFLSLNKYHINTVPVSLVSLPSSSTSSAFPKLTPYPSWNMHFSESGNRTKIIEAKGLEVDSVGRLWVLDSGSEKYSARLWIVDLTNNENKIIHTFSFHGSIHDLVLDETPNGTFAYISRLEKQHIIVFSLEANQSWIVDTPGMNVNSIALSTKKPRRLYLGHSNGLYSISVAELRNGLQTANPKQIGKWNAQPYSMRINKQGIMCAAFFDENYISCWNTLSQKFEEQRVYEDAGLNSAMPFTLTLHKNGFLIFVFNLIGEPKYSLLKVEVSAESLNASAELDGASGGDENIVENNATHQNEIWLVLPVLVVVVVCFVIFLKCTPWLSCLAAKLRAERTEWRSCFNRDDPTRNQLATVAVEERSRSTVTISPTVPAP